MNGKIMMGAGVFLIAGAVAAFAYEQAAVGAALFAAGIAPLVIGNRQSKGGMRWSR